MRSTKINFKKSMWRTLLLFCFYLGSSASVFSVDDASANSGRDKISVTKTYYVTWDIDRGVGPYLRQVKARIPSVPAPHNDAKLYGGRSWDDLADLLLTKNDSSSKKPFPVMIPLPAACFDKSLAADKKSSCLKDSAAFANGALEMSSYEVRGYKTIKQILETKGVPEQSSDHKYYHQDRWINVVKNFNPKLGPDLLLQPGTVLMLPSVIEQSVPTNGPVISAVPTPEPVKEQPVDESNIISMSPETAAQIADAEPVPAPVTKDAADSDSKSTITPVTPSAGQIYFVTMSIDRKAGPYLRQIKARIPTVPAPFNDRKNYDGREWDEVVDQLLTKQDSDLKSPMNVMVPLPAACFDKVITPARKAACLKDPSLYAAGAINIRVHQTKAGDTIGSILIANGVPQSGNNTDYYTQQRWVNVVKNFNLNSTAWGAFKAGEVIVLPLVSRGGAAMVQDSASLAALKVKVDSESINADPNKVGFQEVKASGAAQAGSYQKAVEAAENAARIAKIADQAKVQKEAAEADALKIQYDAAYAKVAKNKAAEERDGVKSEATEAAEALKDAKAAEAEQAAEAAKAAEASAKDRAEEAAAAAEAARAGDLARAAQAVKAVEAAKAAKAAEIAKAAEAARIAEAARAAETAKAAEGARAARTLELSRVAEAAKASQTKKAAEALAAARAAEALAAKVATESARSVKAAEAAKSAEAAVTALATEAAERAKRLAEAQRSMSGRSGEWQRLPGKTLSATFGRNVLSSAKSPMLKKQTNGSLRFSSSDDDSFEVWIEGLHSSFVKAQSESELITKTDDPREYFRFSNINLGAKFYFQGIANNLELDAGVYARLAIMDIRYYISNQSDGVAYLLEDHTDHNIGLGFTGGLTLTKQNLRYRLGATKDLYEFIDQSLLIDRSNNRFTMSYVTPRPKGRAESQRIYDAFVESETVDVQVVDEAANLQAQMKRFSFGLGAGVTW